MTMACSVLAVLSFFISVLQGAAAADAASRRKLPKINAKGMMRWKTWWWNDRTGMRQCDDPYGCNDMDEPVDKVTAIKNHWKIDDDTELLAYIRQVRAHARTHSWRENGRVYSFCTKYQGDLQEVLDYLELRHEHNARIAAKSKRQVAVVKEVVDRSNSNTKTNGAVLKEDVDLSTSGIKMNEVGVNYTQARDQVEEVETWQQTKESAVEASSWVVLALGTAWSYFTGLLHWGNGKQSGAEL